MSLWWNIIKLKFGRSNRIREHAAEALGKLGDARAVEPLIAALKDSDQYVRMDSAEALGKLGDARAVEPLIAALEDEFFVRVIAEALGKIGSARAVEALITTLGNSCKYEHAVEALVKIGAAAVEPLIATLKDSDRNVRKAAVEALDKLGWKPTSAEQRVLRAITQGNWAGAVNEGQAAVDPLIAALNDSDKFVCRSAAEALVQIGSASVEPLIAALKDSDRNVRKAAVDVLGRIKHVRAVKPLIATLKDSDKFVCSAAAEVLGKIGDARAVDPLIALFKVGNENVLRIIAELLCKLQWEPTNAEQRVMRAIAEQNWEAAVKEGPAAVDPLIAALKYGNEAVRGAVAEALGKIGDARAVDPILNLLCKKITDKGYANKIEHLLRSFLMNPSAIATEVLQRIASITNARVIDHVDFVASGEGCNIVSRDDHWGTLDCAYLRQLARLELVHRGLNA